MNRVVRSAIATLVALLAATSVAAASGKPVAPGAATEAQFVSAATCGCHSGLQVDWQQSMHAKALSDPLFVAKVAEADKATNGALGPFCRTCHEPAGTMTGAIGKAGATASNEGVNCTFCHQLSGVASPVGNVSQLFEAGPYRAQLVNPTAPHAVAFSAMYAKAEICGGCHNVNHPVNGMHLESTYSEWLASPAAKDGIVCQDCHMTQPGKIGPSSGWAAGGGAERPNIYRMNFIGAQVGLGDAGGATALLKSAARVTMEASQIAKTGDSAQVVVTVTNKNRGHYLPTGLTEVREMWLELSVDGKQAAERKFGTVLRDAKGKYPVELWDAVGIQSDDRIAPGQSSVSTFTITMPDTSKGAVITAELKYRSAPEEFAKKAGANNPTTVMASAETVVWDTAAHAATAARETSKSANRDSALGLWFAIAGLVVIAATIIAFARR